MPDILHDLRYAFRTFRQSSAFTTVVVLSLALGIGANTALFSFVDAIFLRQIPVRDADALVVFGWQSGPSSTAFSPARGGVSSVSTRGRGEAAITTREGTRFPAVLVERLRSEGKSLTGIAAFASADMDASIDNSGDEITAQLISGNYFEVLGVSAAIGRTIMPDDDVVSAGPAAVISHGFWRRRFAQDPAAIGKTVTLNGSLRATIVGVTPQEFHIGRGVVPDFSIPLAFEPQLARGLLSPENWGVGIVSRVRPGITVEQVHGNLQGVFRGLALEEKPNTAQADLPRLEVISASQGFTTEIVSDYFSRLRALNRFALLAVLAGVFLVLLVIVCLNVANLLIARATTRQYEIGVRLALGASRGRLIRQLLTESVSLALLGGALGIVFAYAGKDLLRLALEQDIRSVTDLRVDPAVLGFSALVSLLTGIFFGMAPALRATRMDVNATVKQGGRSVSGSRSSIGRTLLVTQVAMSMVLLVGASLLLRTVGNLPDSDFGFNTENILVFQLNVVALGGDRGRYEQVSDGIQSVPGVLGLTTSSAPFLSRHGAFSNGQFHSPGTGREPVDTEGVRLHDVQSNFFDTLGIPLLRGRGFDRDDGPGSPRVVVITESLARKIDGDPIGWQFRQGRNPDAPAAEIVGVVKNVGVSEVGTGVDGTIFYAASQKPGLMSTFEVRTAQAPLLVIPAIREALRRIDPNLRASQVSSETELAERKLAPTRYIAVAWFAFGGVALLLTSIGLYGLLSHGIARRTNEIGIRMALGARPFHVLRVVMMQVFALVFAGIALGLALSLVVNALIRRFIYGVTFNDPLTFTVAAAIMLAVSTLASYVPARRAIHVEPTVALRHE